MRKIFITIIMFYLSLPSSFAQITEHSKSNQSVFNLTDSTTIDIYTSSNITEIAEWEKLKPEVRQRRIVDKLVELFREKLPTITPEYGKNDLPSIYSGKLTLNSKKEMKEFFNKSKSDFVLIVSNVTSIEKQGTQNNYNTGTSYTVSGNKTIKINFELWDTKKQVTVLDFEINQDGGTWVDKVLSDAVNYIKNKGTAVKKVINFK